MSVLFFCIHGKWTWVRQWQIIREPLCGSRDLSHASPKFISHERRKKDTYSLIKTYSKESFMYVKDKLYFLLWWITCVTWVTMLDNFAHIWCCTCWQFNMFVTIFPTFDCLQYFINKGYILKNMSFMENFYHMQPAFVLNGQYCVDYTQAIHAYLFQINIYFLKFYVYITFI